MSSTLSGDPATEGPVMLRDVEAKSGTGPITIVLADDHRVVRSGLRMLLEAEDRFEVLAEAGDVSATEQKVLGYRPQVLVLDLNMGGESSLAAIPRLRKNCPETQIVALTMQDDPAFAREALRSGALGYVLKEAADAELVNAVELAAQENPGVRRCAYRGAHHRPQVSG